MMSESEDNKPVEASKPLEENKPLEDNRPAEAMTPTEATLPAEETVSGEEVEHAKARLHIPEHDPEEASKWWVQTRDTRSTSARRRSRRHRKWKFYYLVTVSLTLVGIVCTAIWSLLQYYLSTDTRDIFTPKAKVMMTLEPLHQGVIRQLTFSPDGKYLISASEDKTAILWDIQTGKKLRVLEGHTDAVTSVAAGFLSDVSQNRSDLSQLLVLTGSKDRFAILWNVDTNPASPIYRLGEQPPLEDISMNIQDTTDDLMHLLDGGEEKSANEIPANGHVNAINCVALSPDVQLAISGSNDKYAILWNVHAGSRCATVNSHTESVQAVAFSPNGRYYATAGNDNKIFVWNVRDNSLLHTLVGHSGSIMSLCFSDNGQVLLSGSRDRTAICWDMISGKMLGKLFAQTEIRNAFISPDARFAMTNMLENTVVLWDIDTSKKLLQAVMPAPVLASAMSPITDSSGRPLFAAVVTTDNRIMIFSLLDEK